MAFIRWQHGERDLLRTNCITAYDKTLTPRGIGARFLWNHPSYRYNSICYAPRHRPLTGITGTVIPGAILKNAIFKI
jgi:hypothetical protein